MNFLLLPLNNFIWSRAGVQRTLQLLRTSKVVHSRQEGQQGDNNKVPNLEQDLLGPSTSDPFLPQLRDQGHLGPRLGLRSLNPLLHLKGFMVFPKGLLPFRLQYLCVNIQPACK